MWLVKILMSLIQFVFQKKVVSCLKNECGSTNLSSWVSSTLSVISSPLKQSVTHGGRIKKWGAFPVGAGALIIFVFQKVLRNICLQQIFSNKLKAPITAPWWRHWIF